MNNDVSLAHKKEQNLIIIIKIFNGSIEFFFNYVV